MLNEWNKGSWLNAAVSLTSDRSSKKVLICFLLVGPSFHALFFNYHTGVAYTSECFPCKPGTFSDKPGSFNCQVCPRNTYSEKGAKECIKCDEHSQFSGRTSLCQFMFFVFSLNLCLLRMCIHKTEATLKCGGNSVPETKC